MIIQLGNHAPQDGRTDVDGVTHHEPMEGRRVTSVHVPAGTPLAEVLATVTGPRGVWANHCAEGSPAWVASDDELVEQVLAGHYGCGRGLPDDLEAAYHTSYGPPGVGPDGPVTKAKRGGK